VTTEATQMLSLSFICCGLLCCTSEDVFSRTHPQPRTHKELIIPFVHCQTGNLSAFLLYFPYLTNIAWYLCTEKGNFVNHTQYSPVLPLSALVINIPVLLTKNYFSRWLLQLILQNMFVVVVVVTSCLVSVSCQEFCSHSCGSTIVTFISHSMILSF